MPLPCMANHHMFPYLKPGAASAGPLSSLDSCEAYAAAAAADVTSTSVACHRMVKTLPRAYE